MGVLDILEIVGYVIVFLGLLSVLFYFIMSGGKFPWEK